MITSINNILKLTELPSVTLLFGQEEFFIEEAYNSIIAKFVNSNGTNYNFDEFDASAKEIDINYIIDMASSVPMLGGERIIAVKNFHELFKGRLDKKKHSNAPIAKYLLNPNPSTKLIFLATEKSIDGFSKKGSLSDKVLSSAKYPYHLLLEHHQCVEFPKVWENEMPAIIINRFAQKNKSIDIEAARYLLARCNPELRQIINEIEKIDIYYKNQNQIQSSNIDHIIGSSRSYNIFELQKTIGQKKLDSAIFILNKMMSESRQEMLIITMLARYFSVLWKLFDMRGDNLNQYQIAGKVGISPAFANDYLSALKYYSPSELNNAFIALADTDEELKSSSIDSVSLLQNMLIKIIG